MSFLNETACKKGAAIKKLWRAEEARLVKHFLKNFSIRQWNGTYTYVDRSDQLGAWVLYIPQAGAGTLYPSYFKVIDSTVAAGTPIIGVTDGGWISAGDPTNCGAVKVNGAALDIPIFTETMTAAGVYYVWLHSWIADAADSPWVAGGNSQIIVGDADDTDEPDNPNDGIGYASQLLGRFTITSADSVLSMSTPTQDYLRGGEHTELLFGDCAGGAL